MTFPQNIARAAASRPAARTLAILGLAAGFAFPGAASAETPAYTTPTQISTPCSELRDVTGPDYDVRLCGVTDVDQFRNDLVGDGSSHCGPGSLFNTLHYIGKRGAPVGTSGMKIADADPLDPADYDLTSLWLYGLGEAAGGVGGDDGGSTLGDNRGAFDVMTEQAKANGWTFDRGETTPAAAPEFGYELAKRLRAAPVQMLYGRYHQAVAFNAPSGGYTRDGGHIVTVVSAKGSIGSGKVELKLHDPGRAADHKIGNYLDTQSQYRLETVTLTRVTVQINGAMKTTWELKGENYQASTRQFVEGFNWFGVVKGGFA